MWRLQTAKNKRWRLNVENTEETPIERLEAIAAAVNSLPVDNVKDKSGHDRMSGFDRKIRHRASDGGVVLPNAQPASLDACDYWSLLMGKQLFQARGAALPVEYEGRLAALSEKRAMTSAGTGTGEELVEVAQSADLLRDIYLATNVMAALPAINMPSGKMKLGQITSDATFYKPSAEATAVTVTDLGTAERDFIAYTLKAQVDVSDELAEDSIVALLPQLRTLMLQNCAQAIDEAIVNADASTGTQNINYYAASGGSNLATTSRFLLGFDGLIHLALNEASGMTVDVGTLEAADFVALLAKMGKYGINPKSVVFITDIWTYLKAIMLDEVKTFERMGAKATISTGELAQIWGIPVIVSGQMAKANATGQVDQTAGNNTKGRIVAVNRDVWRCGLARPVSIKTERSESKTMTSIVASFRLALQCWGDRSSVTHTALGYDVTI
jgi:HK97 family phage major capsid protein